MGLQGIEWRDRHGGYRHGHELAASLQSGCSVELQIGVVLSGEIPERFAGVVEWGVFVVLCICKGFNIV